MQQPTPVMLGVEQIKNNESNPRLIKDANFKKLVKSIKDFPEMLNLRPIVVSKDMVILGGNMRYRAAIEAGHKELPVIIADNLTPEQEREFIIKDNVSGGEWDWDMLANEWDVDLLSDWGLDTFDAKPIKEEYSEKEIGEALPTTNICPRCSYEY